MPATMRAGPKERPRAATPESRPTLLSFQYFLEFSNLFGRQFLLLHEVGQHRLERAIEVTRQEGRALGFHALRFADPRIIEVEVLVLLVGIGEPAAVNRTGSGEGRTDPAPRSRLS